MTAIENKALQQISNSVSKALEALELAKRADKESDCDGPHEALGDELKDAQEWLEAFGVDK